MVVAFGLFHAAKEVYDGQAFTPFRNSNTGAREIIPGPEDHFDCFLTAVGTFIGIPEAKNIWKSLLEGASERTVISSLRLIGRRVAGVVTVVIMVYDAGHCLNWW